MTENWGVLGHRWAVDLLKRQVKRSIPRHAYLITGPQGVGKRTLALRFIQALNSLDSEIPGEYDPGTTTNQQIERMQHPDLLVVERQEGDRDIKIGAVRSLQHNLALAPYMSAYKTALALNFEIASNSAANALLKTLEEPPPRVIMILTADSPEALPATIASRCEILRLRLVDKDSLSEGLQSVWNLPADQARLLAHISGGRPGYALDLHHHPENLQQRKNWLDEHHVLLSDSRIARFAYAQNAAKDKDSLKEMLQLWLTYWRDILMRSADADTPLTNLDREKEIQQLAGEIPLQRASQVIASIEHTLDILKKNVNTRLAAEVLLLNMPNI